MDDILIASYMPFERTQRLLHWLCTLFFMFGIEVNDTKSVLEPSLCVEFLGFVVSVNGKLSLSASRHAKVVRLAKKLLHYHNS